MQEKFQINFISPDLTVRKIHGREIVSFSASKKEENDMQLTKK